MKRRMRMAALACCCLLALQAARAAAQTVNLGGPRQKITTASNVRARVGPETAAQEVARLKLGTVLTADGRTAEQSEIGGKTDYWYRVALPGGAPGWVFGGLLADYEEARRGETVRHIVDERLKVETMSFDDASDLYDFVTGPLVADARGSWKGELELARLHALNRAAGAMAETEQGRPAAQYKDFHKAHEKEIYHHEFAGGWAVRPELFWELETKYRGTSIGDRIAWDAAHALRQGECEGDDVCNFLALNDTEGKYLGLYPNGAHAPEALQDIAQALSSTALDETLKRKGGDQYAVQEQTAVRKALAELRAAVAKAESPERAAVVKRLNQLSPRGR